MMRQRMFIYLNEIKDKKEGVIFLEIRTREERKKKKNTVAKDGLNCMVKHEISEPLSVCFVKDLEPR